VIVRKDLLFGSLAVADMAVTKEQLEESLKAQRENRFYKSLGLIMMEKGYLDRERARELLRIQEENLKEAAGIGPAGSGETLFGAVAVMKRFATLTQVEECLDEQRRLRRLGIFLRLGEILVSRRYMSVGQVLSVLRRQSTRVLSCSRCNKRFNVTAFSNRKRFFCNVCGAELVQPDYIESVSVDDRIDG
jgi:hypothetical protein